MTTPDRPWASLARDNIRTRLIAQARSGAKVLHIADNEVRLMAEYEHERRVIRPIPSVDELAHRIRNGEYHVMGVQVVVQSIATE